MEGAGVIVPGLDPGFQRGLELVERAEHAALQAAPLQLGEPPPGLVDLGGVGGGEVQLDAGVGQQPLVHRRRLAGGEVVTDDVDVQA